MSTSTFLHSGINTLYVQNPVFEIAHDESVKVYPHMYNGNVQQNPLCVESSVQPTCTSCTTEEYTGNNGIFPYLRAGEPASP